MNQPNFPAGGMSLSRWCDAVGIGRSTAYEWRESGMLKGLVNILGILYVPRESDEEFWQRAKAGEFAKDRAASINRKNN